MTTLDSIVAVIPNWGTPDFTIRAADCLIQDGVPPERIVVVENGSGDDSYDRLRSRLPDCLLIGFDENVGYGRAVNAGASALRGSAYLLLNNDAFVHRPGSIAAMVDALEDESVGIVAPRLLNEDLTLQPSVVPASSPAVALARASGLSRLVPNRWQPSWGTRWDHAGARAIHAAMGAVFLVRGKVWRGLGGFDERIYMYAEDLDLCWRARKLGWKVWFTPAAEFLHLHHASTKRHWTPAEQAERIGRSESAIIREHLGRLSGLATIGCIAAGLAVRWPLYALAGNRHATERLRGSLRGLLGRS
jgi:N-acetylglucosaminyl-diphospho-decaprenol L-rhamnosyltransferase